MQSGKVVASIQTIVNDLKPITYKQVIYEAVTNSLQANATDIKIKFIPNSERNIDSIIVEDNGDGFNKTNTKSFREYRSTYKKHLGCKGIGRFLFLKLFERVEIESLDKQIEFTVEKDIEVVEGLEFKETLVKFLNPKDSFVVDYKAFKEDLKSYFLAYFKLLKDEKRSIKVSICENEEVYSIVESDDINIDKLSEANLQRAKEEAPFLIYYLQDNEANQESKILIKEAKKRLEKDKAFLRDSKNESSRDYQDKLAIVTQSELTEYIYDRQKKINLLKKLTDEKALEKEIHNLFMKQRTTDGKEDYRTNNLWLFDDRFMTYDKIFSETQIKDIFPNLIANTKRPDILSLSIVSNSYNKEEITDIVIIELKRPNEDIEPSGAETQLLRYSRYINESRKSDSKIRIWTYAFLKFNKETEFDLDNRSYNKIPIQGEYPIYYKYYEKPNTIINFLDYRAMAIDANNRNKTFMKILGGVSVFNS